MAQLALFNKGVLGHFPVCGISWYFCEVNFRITILWYFCEVLLVVGGFIWFPLHMTMVWYLARGAGILAPSDAIEVYVCISKHQSALIGGDRDSQLHRRAEG